MSKVQSRRHFLAAGVSACLGRRALSAQSGQLKLIAHRGGVVDERLPENSSGALHEAIRRGYWMVEVDIRASRDARLVVHHDANFERFYNDPRTVAETDWSQIRRLRSTPGGYRPLLFEEFAALCRGKMRLMMDTKDARLPAAMLNSMEASLRKNDLLDSALFIGSEQSRKRFRGLAPISANRQELRAAMARGEAKDYFLFEHGRTLDAEGLALAARAGVPAVVSINIFHYAGLDHMVAAKADVERLRALGMTYFQIDSVYDPWLLSGTS